MSCGFGFQSCVWDLVWNRGAQIGKLGSAFIQSSLVLTAGVFVCLGGGAGQVGVTCVTQLFFLKVSCRARPGPGLGLYLIFSLEVGGFRASWLACCHVCYATDDQPLG